MNFKDVFILFMDKNSCKKKLTFFQKKESSKLRAELDLSKLHIYLQ